MRSMLVLLLLAAGLGFGLWWTGQAPAEQEGAATREAALEGRRVLECTEIRFVRQKSLGTVVLRRENGLWRMAEPLRDVASLSRIHAIAGAYDVAVLVPAMPADGVTEEYLAATGLDEPDAWVEFRYIDREPIRIEIGGEGPLGSDRFVRRGGAVWRGQVSLYSALQVNISDLRQRTAVSTLPEDIERLSVERRGVGDTRESFEIRRVGGRYRLVEPDLRLDGRETFAFLQQVCGMQIDQFLPGVLDPESPAAPRDPDVRLVVRSASRIETIEVFDVETSMTARHVERGVAFGLDPIRYRSAFGVSLEKLRSRALLSRQVEEVAKVTVDLGAGVSEAMVLTRRQASNFRMVAPISAELEPTPVAELMSALLRVGVQQFVDGDLETMGLGDAAPRVVLEGRVGRGKDVIVFGSTVPEDETLRYVRRADEKQAGIMAADVVAAVLRDWTRYVSREVTKVGRSDSIHRVVVQDPADRSVRAAYNKNAEGGWIQEGVDRSAPIHSIVNDLAELEGIRVWPLDGFEAEATVRHQIVLESAVGTQLGRFVLAEFDADGDDRPRFLAVLPGRKYSVEIDPRDARDILELVP